MRRRDLFSNLFFAAGAATMAVQSASPQKPIAKPYGAVKVEDTDTEQFATSMLEQMHEAGLPPPETYTPFPEKFTGDPIGDQKVLGESLHFPLLDDFQKPFNADFRGQPQCDGLALRGASFNAWRTFVALHETTHYITRNTPDKNGRTIQERVFRHVNNVPEGSSIQDHIQSVQQLIHQTAARYNNGQSGYEAVFKKTYQDENVIRRVGANLSLNQIDERISDVSATLYILSNYGNTHENREFLEKIMDFRRAYYKDDPQVNPDGSHDTASSIEAAIKEFEKHPRKGMSIVETTKRAAVIVEQHTKRKPAIYEKIAKIELSDAADLVASPQDAAGLTPRDKNKMDAEKNGIINSRNRACLISP